MKVTIIGARSMGRAIGTRAVAGGHHVEIVDRDATEAQKLVQELGGSTTAFAEGAAFAATSSSSPSTTPASRTPSASTRTSSRA